MKLFKILFSIFFLVLTVLWILFTINFFGWRDGNWEWIEKIPGISSLNQKLNDFVDNRFLRLAGLKMLLIGGSITLGYTTVFYPIKKIPILGKLIKILTFLIPIAGGLLIVIGVILLALNINNGSTQSVDLLLGNLIV